MFRRKLHIANNVAELGRVIASAQMKLPRFLIHALREFVCARRAGSPGRGNRAAFRDQHAFHVFANMVPSLGPSRLDTDDARFVLLSRRHTSAWPFVSWKVAALSKMWRNPSNPGWGISFRLKISNL
ncbi:hypothetical protein [Caballeronia arvi]|uniref:hypothetical protein n=1 Tax=Caballeronia arvi TaxID=1777135 RepID=UPI00135A3ADA|nr:hypothetical protein [Caballeronia arvi]